MKREMPKGNVMSYLLEEQILEFASSAPDSIGGEELKYNEKLLIENMAKYVACKWAEEASFSDNPEREFRTLSTERFNMALAAITGCIELLKSVSERGEFPKKYAGFEMPKMQ